MAGGTWVVQNKVLPGTYINTVSEPRTLGNLGVRGVVTFAMPLNWGPNKQIIELTAGDDTRSILGYDLTAPQMLLVKEAYKRALTVKLYGLGSNTAATATVGSLKINAKYGGTRGNDVSVTIQPELDDPGSFLVRTLLDGRVMNEQRSTNIAGLQSNDWVTFQDTGGDGALTATAGAPLTGGANGAITNADHTDYLNLMETQDWNTMALVSDDNTLKSVYVAYIKRMRENEGRKMQLVLNSYPTADYEGVISVKNGVVLSDGTIVNQTNAVVWVAAATAAAQVNQSLTYDGYDDAVDVNVRYTNSQQTAALQNGEFVFVYGDEQALVLQDINTFTSFTPDHNKTFSKNRLIRVLDSFANDLKLVFERGYIGKVNNNTDGRNLFKNEVLSYLRRLEGINAVQDVANEDVTVMPGEETDSIYVEVAISPVDSVEKIYMKARVA